MLFLRVCMSSQKFVYYDEREKVILGKILKIYRVVTSWCSVFVWYGYLQQAETARKPDHALAFNMYVDLER